MIEAPQFNQHIISDLANFDSFIDFSDQFEHIVFDIETKGLHIKKAELWGFSICFDSLDAFYIPWRNKDESRFWTVEQESYILNKVYTLCKHKKLIGHNIIFDVLVIKNNWNIDLTDCIHCDTILLKHMIDEERPFGLKEISTKYLGEWANHSQHDLKENIKENGGKVTQDEFDLYKADLELIAKYAMWDVILTWELFKLFSPKLKQEGLYNLFYIDEVMPLYKEVTIPMKWNGIGVDVPFFKELHKNILKDIDTTYKDIYKELIENDLISDFEALKLEKEFPVKMSGNFPKAIACLVGIEDAFELSKQDMVKKYGSSIYNGFYEWWVNLDASYEECLSKYFLDARRILWKRKYDDKPIFNLGSDDHIAWLFFEKLGVKSTEKTKGGKPSVSAEVLEELSGQHPIADTIITLRKLKKLEGTYIRSILEKQIDGVLYSDVLLFGTTSGRSSGTAPNLMNLPSLKGESGLFAKYTNSIRKGIVGGEGNKIIGSDFCLHPKTEILTKRGFVPILEVNKDDYVWQVDQYSLEGNWILPSRLVKRNYTGKMYSFGNRRGCLDVTEKHTMLYIGQQGTRKPSDTKYRKVALSDEMIPNSMCNLPTSSICSFGKNTFFSEKEIWTVCALQADGSKNRKSQDGYGIEVSVEKKVKVCDSLFKKGRISAPNTKQTLHRHYYYTNFTSLLLDNSFEKNFKLENLGENQVSLFIKALSFWDSSFVDIDKNKFLYISTNEKNIDQVQAYLVRCGFEAKKRKRKKTNNKHKQCWHLFIKPFRGIRLRKEIDCKKYLFSGLVGCVTVEKGFILVRSEGQTFVTGNCSLEPTLASYVSGDKELIDVFVSGKDFYSVIGMKQFGIVDATPYKDDTPDSFPEKYKKLRKLVKTYSLASMYGASPSRIAEVLGISNKEAATLIDNYFINFPSVKKFIDKTHIIAVQKGYVTTKFGRKRHLQEAKRIFDEYGWGVLAPAFARKRGIEKERRILKNLLNNAVNFQIQGLAAHALNRACISITREFKKRKLISYIAMTIHDEILVVSPKKEASVVKDIVKISMENCIDISPIKLGATPVIADSYADAK